MDEALSNLSNDDLVRELTSWAGRLAAGQCRFLALLAEFDARGACEAMGMGSTAQWAGWRLGVSRGAAREWVRVARALRELPLAREQMSLGQLSYSQVRAISRIATPRDERTWVELAQVTTADQLERAICGVRRARDEDGPTAQQARQQLTTRWDDNGDLLITCRVSAANAPAVLARIEQAQQAEQAERDALYAELSGALRAGQGVSAETLVVAGDVSAGTPAQAEGASAPPYAAAYVFVDPPYPRLSQLHNITAARPEHEQAALEEYWAERRCRQVREEAARAWQEHVEAQAAARELPPRWAGLVDGLIRALTRPEGLKQSVVHLHVDPLSGWARTDKDLLLPRSTLDQVLETLPGRGRSTSPLGFRPLTPADLRLADLGRHSRLVSPALRRLLGQLDGERCRFPGCSHTRNLHAHHVRYWRDGGPTDLANLVLVCERHHTLIHTRGFQLVLSPDDRALTVRTADDIPVPHHSTPPTGTADELPVTDPFDTERTGDPFSLEFVVWVTCQHTG